MPQIMKNLGFILSAIKNHCVFNFLLVLGLYSTQDSVTHVLSCCVHFVVTHGEPPSGATVGLTCC